MKFPAAIIFCMFSFACFSQKQKVTTNARFAGLDTAFARVLKDWKAAGFAVAVVEKDKIVYAKGFGYKDWEIKAPVTENTLFAIGSCTKAFTASLIGLLNKDGKVEFDKPVRTYLPSLSFYNNDMNDNVTLRDMMCHRTGVSRYDYSWYFFPSRSKDTLVQRIQYMEPSEPLRQKWQYNNFMFLLQGVVVEKLTGKSWEDNIREKLFQPLGMNNSNVSLSEWTKTKDIAVGYNLKQDSIIHKTNFYDISGMAPAGSINSSVSDMSKWVTLWINGGKYQGKEILPAPYITEAISSQMVIAGGLPGKKSADVHMLNYGFGWMLSSYRGHYRAEHGGNIDGFSASTSIFPSDSIGIVVLCNQNGSQVPGIVRNLLTDRMLGLKYKDWETEAYSADLEGKAKTKEAKKTIVSSRKTGTKTSHPLNDYTGTYTSVAKESFDIELKNDSLFLTGSIEPFWLRHFHYDVFELQDKEDRIENDSTNNDNLKIMFRMDESGNIASASLPLAGPVKPIVFTRGARAKTLSKDSLERYVGDYTLGGAIAKIYIKGQNTMFLFVPGQPEYELIATGKDMFTIKILSGYSLQFTSNAKGEITEVLFVQPNGTFKAIKVIKL
ncbi:MAG: serine hydrolase [Chitinophagaceae bacterium]